MNARLGKFIRGGVSAALLGALLACSRESPTGAEIQETNSVRAVIPAEITALKVAPEQMMSRPDTNPVVADEITDTRHMEPVSLSGLKPGTKAKRSSAASRIVYRYVQPLQMISEADVRDLGQGVERADEENITEILQPADASRMSDMAAMAYVRRSRMLSDGRYSPASKADKRDVPDDGIGFFAEEEMMFDEEALILAAQPSSVDDPEKVQQAMYFVREAESKLAAGMLDDAEKYYDKALLLFPDTTFVNKRLGHICLSQGKYDRAIGYFSAALDTDEFMAESLNELGIAYLYAGRSEKALASFNAAINADDQFVEPVYNAGLALRQLNQLAAAREKIEEFLRREPGDARAYRELGMLSLAESNEADALAMLEQAMILDDSWSMPYLDAAVIYVASTNYIKALEALDLALDRTTPVKVFRLYNAPAFREVRLMAESRPFEARLSNKLRGLF